LPLYEYRCQKCGATLEKIQKFSDRPLTKCPKCGGSLERLVSSPSIRFKGSGWYVNDYPRKPSADSTKSDGDSSGKGDSAASGSKKDKPLAVGKTGDSPPAPKK
jgi:putative FmdB family regulatory protein